MATRADDPGWWRLWRSNPVLLALIAALFGALTNLNDTNVARNWLVGDFLPSVLVYLVLGSWVGLATMYVYNKLAGKWLEPTYTGEKFMTWNEQKYALGAGVLAAIKTFAYLFVARAGSASLLIVLSGFVLIWLAGYDAVTKGINLRRTLGVIVLVLVGSFMVSLESWGGGITIAWWAVLVMIFASSLPDAISRTFEAKAAPLMGNVNLTFWRFFWLAVSATIMAFATAWGTGVMDEFLSVFSNSWLSALPWVMLTMVFAYSATTTRIMAQGLDSLSTVGIVETSKVVMAIPLMYLVSLVLPLGTFSTPAEPFVYVLQFVGSLLVGYGVYIVATQSKSK